MQRFQDQCICLLKIMNWRKLKKSTYLCVHFNNRLCPIDKATMRFAMKTQGWFGMLDWEILNLIFLYLGYCMWSQEHSIWFQEHSIWSQEHSIFTKVSEIWNMISEIFNMISRIFSLILEIFNMINGIFNMISEILS